MLLVRLVALYAATGHTQVLMNQLLSGTFNFWNFYSFLISSCQAHFIKGFEHRVWLPYAAKQGTYNASVKGSPGGSWGSFTITGHEKYGLYLRGFSLCFPHNTCMMPISYLPTAFLCDLSILLWTVNPFSSSQDTIAKDILTSPCSLLRLHQMSPIIIWNPVPKLIAWSFRSQTQMVPLMFALGCHSSLEPCLQ